MTLRHLVGSLIAVGVTLAACTTEQQSDPAPTLTSTTSTTAPPVETTEPAPETTAAPTTEATTTTSTTLPPGPADAIVPLLVGGADGGWLFLGSWQSDRWEDATDDSGAPTQPSIAAGTNVVVSSLDGDREGALGSSVEACFDGRVGPTIDVDLAAPDPPGFGYGAVAMVAQDWPLTPRPVAVTATGPTAYQALGEEIFAGDPVDPTAGRVVEVVVADLDGDDDDEAVVAFEFIQPSAGTGAPGDMSALFVVDTASRTPATVLASHVQSDLPEEFLPIIERSRVIDVADYNGDGRMEVAVHTWYYEGASVVLYEYDGTTLTEVLSTGCGV